MSPIDLSSNPARSQISSGGSGWASWVYLIGVVSILGLSRVRLLHHQFQLLRFLEPLRVSAFAAFSPISGDPGLAVTFKHPRRRSRRFDAIFKQRSADADLSNFLNLQSRDLGCYKPGVLSVALSTPNDAYREGSIKETQRVIDMTRALKPYFPNTTRPMIVANIGRF